LVSRAGSLAELPPDARVGTSSLRRVCQLRARRRDLRLVPLRGNVDTRLRKLDDGELDAIVLAAAGLLRLGRGDRISETLPFEISLPAIGQGALGLETREDDDATRSLVGKSLHDQDSASCVAAERAFLRCLGGGCQTPLAAHATLIGDTLELQALVGEPDGSVILRERGSAPRAHAETLGVEVAERLLARGAAEILARCEAPGIVGGP
jgi:hydroxymethylbilane synthase